MHGLAYGAQMHAANRSARLRASCVVQAPCCTERSSTHKKTIIAQLHTRASNTCGLQTLLKFQRALSCSAFVLLSNEMHRLRSATALALDCATADVRRHTGHLSAQEDKRYTDLGNCAVWLPRVQHYCGTLSQTLDTHAQKHP